MILRTESRRLKVLGWQCTRRKKVIQDQLDSNKAIFRAYDAEIMRQFKEDDFPIDGSKPDPEKWADAIENDKDFRLEFMQSFGSHDVLEGTDDRPKDPPREPTPDVTDNTYLNLELSLPCGDDGPTFAWVKRRARDSDNQPIGIAHNNPILDTRMFKVEFDDGYVTAMAANAIAQNLYSQVDEEGNRLLLMDEIIDCQPTTEAVKQADAFITTTSGRKRRKETTKGWELLVRWKDGSTTWSPLKDMKECYPVQTAEYAVLAQVNEEPAFAWWVPFTLKKRNSIIAKVKSKYWERSTKFGIKIPKSAAEAKRFDQENGNTLWWDAICDEMKNVRIAFELFDGSESDIPAKYTKIDCHMIFDVKLGENFRRKARMVAGGHMTDAPSTITYSSVVSRDSVRIAFLIAALVRCFQGLSPDSILDSSFEQPRGLSMRHTERILDGALP